VLRLLVQEWTDRNCAIITANNFSGQYTGTSRTSPVQSAVSVRKSTLNRPFICPIPFCPSFVSVIGGDLKVQETNKITTHTQLLADPLPEPNLPSLDRPWNTVVAGVGGTGVLTIASLIAMAAHIEGKGCATMNQTGMAQKFGAVTSHVRVASTQEAIRANGLTHRFKQLSSQRHNKSENTWSHDGENMLVLWCLNVFR
jgi:hypothetical protein